MIKNVILFLLLTVTAAKASEESLSDKTWDTKLSSMNLHQLTDELQKKDPEDPYPYKKAWPYKKAIMLLLIEKHKHDPDSIMMHYENAQAHAIYHADDTFLRYLANKGAKKIATLGGWEHFVPSLEPESAQLLFNSGYDPCQNKGITSGGLLDWTLSRFIAYSKPSKPDDEERLKQGRQRMIKLAAVLVSNGAPTDGTPGSNRNFHGLSCLQNLLAILEFKKIKNQPIEDGKAMVAAIQETARKRKQVIKDFLSLHQLPTGVISFVIEFDGQTKTDYTKEQIEKFSKPYLEREAHHGLY